MVGKTIRTLENNVLKSKNGLFDLLGEGNYKYNSSNGELIIGKRKIICRGAPDESAEGKIRGLTLAGALCDEVTLFPKNFVTQLIGRCSEPGSQLFWNCNPDSPYHYIKQDYLDNPKMKDQVKHWRFLMTDNPYLVKCNPRYIEDAKKTYSGVFYKRNVLGEWALAEGLIYSGFNDDCILNKLPHELDEDFEYDEIYVGIDVGAVHPTAFIMIGIKDKKVYVIKEYYQSGKSNSQLVEDYIEFVDGWAVNGTTVDSAALSFILELQNRGIYTTDCNKAVTDGLSLVADFIGNNEFFISSSCVNTIQEFYSYSWDDKKSKAQGKDVVIKLNDDAMDALRYACKTFLDFNTRAYAYDVSQLYQ